ncbi:hypothetical protein BDK51DRAFT_41825 [Blyttiomyces helicus]|uniref:Alpha/Beta hydrolase protein n=1 Tax=Blyttiomyces helicus TaxID=388810 RepID=A0A4P9W2W1_9FUNG|nr:hypothetical protein BDK51DRAFT_41825 [Blyttiomyces helicus]|eukprot:RKO85523.1 hypothetical protein BDK51DRAFT_41825 [Blyttiomyces helicus]
MSPPGTNVTANATANAGYILSERTFTYIKVMNAGHEVPLYQPAAALAVLNRLLSAPPGKYVPGTSLSLPLQTLGAGWNSTTATTQAGGKSAASNFAAPVPLIVAIAAGILCLVL